MPRARLAVKDNAGNQWPQGMSGTPVVSLQSSGRDGGSLDRARRARRRCSRRRVAQPVSCGPVGEEHQALENTTTRKVKFTTSLTRKPAKAWRTSAARVRLKTVCVGSQSSHWGSRWGSRRRSRRGRPPGQPVGPLPVRLSTMRTQLHLMRTRRSARFSSQKLAGPCTGLQFLHARGCTISGCAGLHTSAHRVELRAHRDASPQRTGLRRCPYTQGRVSLLTGLSLMCAGLRTLTVQFCESFW